MIVLIPTEMPYLSDLIIYLNRKVLFIWLFDIWKFIYSALLLAFAEEAAYIINELLLTKLFECLLTIYDFYFWILVTS